MSDRLSCRSRPGLIYLQPTFADPDHCINMLDIIQRVRDAQPFNARVYDRILRSAARRGVPMYTKGQLVRGYHALVREGCLEPDEETLRRLRMKPTRTLSGVAPVSVLTRPHICPGQCVFCPSDARLPKSYLADEPGAMRALMLDFDPYRQTSKRIEAMCNVGHHTHKVELLVLGGTWSAYPRDYQAWFLWRCLDAMNGAESATLAEAQARNETARHRQVGLTIETRPDAITPDEVHWLRRLGVTRVQLGAQSLDDAILNRNKRGHTVADLRRAVSLLRGAGFKVALHWMPNLLGATPASDLEDFHRLWDDPALRPDELKIYPTALLPGTELYRHYQRGDYYPYDEEELVNLLAACKALVPRYCRINRVMRDIPAGNIVAGVTCSNLRQAVQARMAGRTGCNCIRCREVRKGTVSPNDLSLEVTEYDTDRGRELFLEATTPDDRLAGFLRLSLPDLPPPIEELEGCAIIRQVQIYGPALRIGQVGRGQAQHQGIGGWLIDEAKRRARRAGFGRLAVIAAVGTRRYYRRHGFTTDDLYMTAAL
jgi:elongator complex protein 3